jgi:hypothetical protein
MKPVLLPLHHIIPSLPTSNTSYLHTQTATMATETEQSIEDLKLSTTFHNNLTIHSRSGTHEQLWARVKMIGAGAFGDVWLEQKVRADHTAELGEAEAEVERVPDVDLRAVKRIRYTGQHLDWSRELKILAQLKNVRVHMLCLCLGDSGEKEGEGAKGRYC